MERQDKYPKIIPKDMVVEKYIKHKELIIKKGRFRLKVKQKLPNNIIEAAIYDEKDDVMLQLFGSNFHQVYQTDWIKALSFFPTIEQERENSNLPTVRQILEEMNIYSCNLTGFTANRYFDYPCVIAYILRPTGGQFIIKTKRSYKALRYNNGPYSNELIDLSFETYKDNYDLYLSDKISVKELSTENEAALIAMKV